jgi:lipopolysaccharide/colanic/teichoic acid biosynthesis glycosyltransferase
VFCVISAAPLDEPAAGTLNDGYGMKRLIDVLGAGFGLLLLSPVILVVALVVKFCLGSPVLFRQVRPGLNGKPFTMCKFRSMTDKRSADGTLLPDSERLTPLGRFLRAASLDELPELYNVLRGEMSLVGPRPLLMEYLDKYTPEQAKRHNVRPGITGWAQVNGRQNLKFSKRLELDVWYVENWSLRLDLQILLKTFYKVIKSDGVKSGQNVTEVDDLNLTQRAKK